LHRIFIQNKIFILLHALFFCIAVSIIIYTDKLQLHLFFNGFVTHPFINIFFKYLTNIGDGAFIILFVLILLFFNVQKSIAVLLCYLISAGFTQAIKYAFFDNSDRPTLIFEMQHIPLKFVQGVNLHIHRSFPSGHTTAAFSLFFCLSLFTKNKFMQVLCFILALLVSFSRVYLSQHFFEDITAGSLIGVVFSFLVCVVLYETKLAQKLNKLQRPIYQLF
jgi:membrane-associated phospholipid phosphatase